MTARAPRITHQYLELTVVHILVAAFTLQTCKPENRPITRGGVTLRARNGRMGTLQGETRRCMPGEREC
jgi:hypothetical protein